MIRLICLLGLSFVLVGCESLYQDDGIPRIRTQSDVDRYNASVSSESEKLVCTRERFVGSNIRSFQCMTVAQRDRMARESQDILENNRAAFGNL